MTPVLVDNHISAVIAPKMVIARIISQTLLLALRLIVALAIFGLSSAQTSASMHGKSCASDVQVSLKQQVHSHSTESLNKLSIGHIHASPAINDGETVNSGVVGHAGAGQSDAGEVDCCKSFCSSVAMLDGALLKDRLNGTPKLNAFVDQQLEAAAEAAIFTPPNA